MNLEKFKVAKAPPTVYYVPDFISDEEENLIIRQVNAAPKPKWTQLSNRRLQNWGGIPHPKGMITEKIPEWLSVYIERIGQTDVFGGKLPNHVLVNEYHPGQGIMPHTDGPLFFPTVTTITCGSHTVLNFCQDIDKIKTDCEEGVHRKHLFSLLLERRSLVIIQDELYSNYLHSIEQQDRDIICDNIVNIPQCKGLYDTGHELERGIRISLTIRHVPHTSKLQLRLSR